MSLLIIRHGETPLNVARVLQPAATPLSERGQAQAQALALQLKSAGLSAILSSDLPRALQTAQAIGRACGLPVLTTPLLHERNFGDLRGLAYDTLDHDPLTAEGAPPGGESPSFNNLAIRKYRRNLKNLNTFKILIKLNKEVRIKKASM